MNKAYYITCHDLEYRRVVLQFLLENGWKLPDALTIDGFLTKFGHCFNLIVYCDKTIGCNSFANSDFYSYLSFEELVAMIKSRKEINFKLNDDYTANYIKGDDFVAVGCQKILVSKIRELLRKIESLG